MVRVDAVIHAKMEKMETANVIARIAIRKSLYKPIEREYGMCFDLQTTLNLHC